MILKWNLEDDLPMKGKPDRRIEKLIRELRDEGVL